MDQFTSVKAWENKINYYGKTWTSGRNDGSKLDSGSLFYNDPALTFRPFEAAKFSLLQSSSFIRAQFSTSSITQPETETFYFNPPYITVRTGLDAYQQGSLIDTPPGAQPIYELDGKNFKSLTKSKPLFISHNVFLFILRRRGISPMFSTHI